MIILRNLFGSSRTVLEASRIHAHKQLTALPTLQVALSETLPLISPKTHLLARHIAFDIQSLHTIYSVKQALLIKAIFIAAPVIHFSYITTLLQASDLIKFTFFVLSQHLHGFVINFQALLENEFREVCQNRNTEISEVNLQWLLNCSL